MEDFANAIAYEVKQEIADRYFGFRSRIENQSKIYLENVQEVSQEIDSGIRLDLCRMRFLLKVPRLFCALLDLAGFPRDYAMTLSSPEKSPVDQDLFMTMKGEGFTRWRRFRGIAMIVYHSLADNISTYCEHFLKLQQDHAEICSALDKFQHQNDLSDILCFLRNFDSPDSERLKFLHSNAGLLSTTLEQDLRIAPPPPVTEVLPVLYPPPPLKQIKEEFNELLRQAFSHHDISKQCILPF
jgi:hypothetical protein